MFFLFLPGLVAIEVLIARGKPQLRFKNPSRDPVSFGKGKLLTYVVLGDSTAAGEGASSYRGSIAYLSAQYLAKNHKVNLINLAVSGARTSQVDSTQVPKAITYKPDVVLLSVGANDVTHLSSFSNVSKSLSAIISSLIKSNCEVKIILTGVPQMGAPPRLAQPLRALAGFEGNRLNKVFIKTSKSYQLSFASIAKETGPLFLREPSLFAKDGFHPNDKGYELWAKVINRALSKALSSQPSHC